MSRFLLAHALPVFAVQILIEIDIVHHLHAHFHSAKTRCLNNLVCYVYRIHGHYTSFVPAILSVHLGRFIIIVFTLVLNPFRDRLNESRAGGGQLLEEVDHKM